MIENAYRFEIGSGFSGTAMKGSEHNDRYEMMDGMISPVTNFAGGVLGGISSGAEIYFTVGFETILENSEALVKSAAAFTILDLLLVQRARNGITTKPEVSK